MTAGTLTYDTKLDTTNFSNGLNKMTSKVSGAGSTIKSIIAGLGITKLIGSAISTINQSIDGAISRYDTLNNFPRVMENLGISGEEASSSIAKMSEKLSGLPTTLDQGASAVQRFTSANGDVEKSTDIFLALNNAIIAGGASTQMQESALEQLSQAYSKGKPDMNEWRTAMTAMPAQLKQVALAMGYVNADELGEALRKGEVSMDEFMDSIIQLNNEGIEGFANFEDQARSATGGIGTAITVAKTQVVKGVTDIIGAIDEALEKAGLGKLGTIIANLGKKAKEALDTIAGLIKGDISPEEFINKISNAIVNLGEKINEKLPELMEKLGNLLNQIMQGLIKNMPEIIKVGMQIISNLIIGIARMLPTLIPQIVDLVFTIVNALLDNLPLLIDAGIELIIGLTLGIVEAIPKIIEEIPVIIDKIFQALTDPDMLIKLIDAGIMLTIKLTEGIIKAIPQLLLAIPKILASIISAWANIFAGIFRIGGDTMAKLKEGFLNKINDIKDGIRKINEAIINKVSEIINKMFNFGKDLIQGFINGIKSMISNVGNAAKSVANKIKSILHFSRPDEGPLREYEKWMPDMIDGLAKTLRNSSSKLIKESEDLAEQLKESFAIDYTEDMYDQIEKAVNKEASSMSFSGVNASVTEILSANAVFEGTIPMQIDLDGEKIYDNQQKVSARKNLQYGGAR